MGGEPVCQQVFIGAARQSFKLLQTGDRWPFIAVNGASGLASQEQLCHLPAPLDRKTMQFRFAKTPRARLIDGQYLSGGEAFANAQSMPGNFPSQPE